MSRNPYLNECKTHVALRYSTVFSLVSRAAVVSLTRFKKRNPIPLPSFLCRTEENSTRLRDNVHNNKQAGSGEGHYNQ